MHTQGIWRIVMKITRYGVGLLLLYATLAAIIAALWFAGARLCGASWAFSIGIGAGAWLGSTLALLSACATGRGAE